MPTDEMAITVEARVAGQRAPLVADWQVPLPLPLHGAGPDAAGSLLLRDVLAHVVRQEVRAFQQRQEERRLVRVLSPQQIDQAVARGKVEMGGPNDLPQGHPTPKDVDEEAAVITALQAFEDGLYFVFLDGQQLRDLDAAVWPRPASRLTFIRLVALAGG